MSLGPRWRRTFRLPLGRRSVERDVDDELAFHLAMREEKLRRLGLEPGRRRGPRPRALRRRRARARRMHHDRPTLRPGGSIHGMARVRPRGFPVCAAHVSPHAGIHHRGHDHAGPRDWRDLGDVHAGQRHSAAPPALSERRSIGATDPVVPGERARHVGHLAGEHRAVPRSGHGLRGLRRVSHGQRHGASAERAGAALGLARDRRLLPRDRRQSRVRPRVHEGGGHAGKEHRGAPQRGPVANALRRRLLDPGQDARDRRAAADDRRRDASRLRLPATGREAVDPDGTRSRRVASASRTRALASSSRACRSSTCGGRRRRSCGIGREALGTRRAGKNEDVDARGAAPGGGHRKDGAAAHGAARGGLADSPHRHGERRDVAVEPSGDAGARDRSARGARRHRHARVAPAAHGKCRARARWRRDRHGHRVRRRAHVHALERSRRCRGSTK